MSKDPKPAALTGDLKFDAATLAEALRILTNPAITDRVQRETTTEGRPQQRVRCISPTGARFTLVIEEGRNKRTGALEQVVRNIEDYEYPYSEELAAVADNYHPPLKMWEGRKFSWGGMPATSIIHPVTHTLTAPAKQKLFAETWQADLRQWMRLTISQGAETGLREEPKSA